MREVNQKIYEIAEMKNPEDEDSVSIGQVITDQILEEDFDVTDSTLSRDEANKVIIEERDNIYGREKTNPNTVTNVKIQEAFGTSPGKKTKKAGTKTGTKIKSGKPTQKKTKKVAKKSTKKKSSKKSTKTKKSSNSSLILLLILVLAGAAYYYLEMQ